MKKSLKVPNYTVTFNRVSFTSALILLGFDLEYNSIRNLDSYYVYLSNASRRFTINTLVDDRGIQITMINRNNTNLVIQIDINGSTHLTYSFINAYKYILKYKT